MTSNAGFTTSVTGSSPPVMEQTTEDKLPSELDGCVFILSTHAAQHTKLTCPFPPPLVPLCKALHLCLAALLQRTSACALPSSFPPALWHDQQLCALQSCGAACGPDPSVHTGPALLALPLVPGLALRSIRALSDLILTLFVSFLSSFPLLFLPVPLSAHCDPANPSPFCRPCCCSVWSCCCG